MSTKTHIYGGMLVGSIIGSFVPMLWGASMFSISAVLLSGAGGILGIIAGYKLANGYF